MFIVLFFVCLDGLPGEKRSGALKTSKTKENRCLVPIFRACGAV
jgi:hypothetical protein